MASSSEATRRWRENNPALWNAQKRRNYALGKPTTAKRRRVWTPEEDILITMPNRAEDRALARQLNCSVQTIQIRRSRLLKKRQPSNETTHTPGD